MLRRDFFKVPYEISRALLLTFIKLPAGLSLVNLFFEMFKAFSLLEGQLNLKRGDEERGI